jgi:adenosylcobinamide kinase/adenosylcobinamide-phosphate guanylyltransferase
MSRIVLITGGSRSGKSAHAQKLAESLPGPRTFIATCPVIDDEMQQRINLHRQARSAADWETLEEPVHLAAALRSTRLVPVVLVDCITLWINNLMYATEQNGGNLSESQITEHCREVIKACEESSGTIIFVTNEVGLGIVPDNAVARRYRDLVGRANQVIAAASDRVELAICGQVLTIKDCGK